MKNNLKLYRTKSGYTQEDISKKIGVSRQTINSIENNRFHPSILLCLKLSKELDCRLDDLFFLESWCGKVTGSYNLIVKFSISITTTKLWESNYSDYQQYLFNRICEYKENNVTPIGYRKISKIFNDEGLKTPRNTEFSNSKVHSMYKKGKIREERINRKDIVEVGDVSIKTIF